MFNGLGEGSILTKGVMDWRGVVVSGAGKVRLQGDASGKRYTVERQALQETPLVLEKKKT